MSPVGIRAFQIEKILNEKGFAEPELGDMLWYKISNLERNGKLKRTSSDNVLTLTELASFELEEVHNLQAAQEKIENLLMKIETAIFQVKVASKYLEVGRNLVEGM